MHAFALFICFKYKVESVILTHLSILQEFICTGLPSKEGTLQLQSPRIVNYTSNSLLSPQVAIVSGTTGGVESLLTSPSPPGEPNLKLIAHGAQ